MSECNLYTVYVLIFFLVVFTISRIRDCWKPQLQYGKFLIRDESVTYVSAKIGWFLMELPSFLVPVLLLYRSGSLDSMGSKLLSFMFCAHYFHRTFIYAVRNNGSPKALRVVLAGCLFCALNGYLQGHSMIYCTHYDDNWTTDFRFISGVALYLVGISINIHSDYILLALRKPGDMGYYIPQGGLFEYVTAANYFGEIVEWFGYAIATSTLPAFTFATYSAYYLGIQAWNHHRYYLEKFEDYPKSRKVLIPLIF
ncbi:3-oxo-5-alpha-steroid 4-dehydrogenase 2-like isoform X1 [Cetorhinus maximus]